MSTVSHMHIHVYIHEQDYLFIASKSHRLTKTKSIAILKRNLVELLTSSCLESNIHHYRIDTSTVAMAFICKTFLCSYSREYTATIVTVKQLAGSGQMGAAPTTVHKETTTHNPTPHTPTTYEIMNEWVIPIYMYTSEDDGKEGSLAPRVSTTACTCTTISACILSKAA